MKAKAAVSLRFATKEQLKTVLNAIKPEAENQASRRARTILEKEGNSLVLNVEAEDTVALRASLNAYLRWTSAILDVLEVLKTQDQEKQV
jgi:tRNA threonylcarbamoyladenosine modification (KEOPS) complex  Pcc1 subunit